MPKVITTPTDCVSGVQAAALTGRGVSTISLAARTGGLAFVLVDGVRAFDRDAPGRRRPPRRRARGARPATAEPRRRGGVGRRAAN